MRALRDFLAERTVVEIAAGFAIGYVLIQFFEALSSLILTAAWPQPQPSVFFNGPEPAQPYLAHLGRHEIYYGGVLLWLITIALTTAATWLAVRQLGLLTWREDELRDCPHCLGRIPAAAHVCEFCTHEVVT